MKKYIVTVPDNKRALFDEIVRENELDVYEVNESDTETGTYHRNSALQDDSLPWIEAQKLIDRNAI